jgi:hypothetical protein
LPHKNNDEKEKLKSILFANKQMVSLTIDCWTSVQNMNYMVVTCHFINERCVLNKKNIEFKFDFGSQGETIEMNLEACLKE